MGKTSKRARVPPPTYPKSFGERAALEQLPAAAPSKAPAPEFKIEMSRSKRREHFCRSSRSQQSAIPFWLMRWVLADYEFAAGLLTQMTDVSRSGNITTEQELNFMLSVVRGINPRDETEALLAAQMAAIHNATMVAARRLNHVETIPQQDSASNMLNKLARTFASQVKPSRNTAPPASKRSRCSM